jgi:hypothetical protein
MARPKQAIVTIDVPSVLNTTLSERQKLKSAFKSDLAGVIKGHSVGDGNEIWNVGRVATEVIVVAGSGTIHGSNRRSAKTAGKKAAKKAVKKAAKK